MAKKRTEGLSKFVNTTPRFDPFGMPLIQPNPSPTQTNTNVQYFTAPITQSPQKTKNSSISDVTPKQQNNELALVQAEVKALKGAFYKNNFISSQDFPKYTRFLTRTKLPTLATAPTTCEIGEVYVNSGTGKLYVCSSANTWTIVGTQS